MVIQSASQSEAVKTLVNKSRGQLCLCCEHQNVQAETTIHLQFWVSRTHIRSSQGKWPPPICLCDSSGVASWHTPRQRCFHCSVHQGSTRRKTAEKTTILVQARARRNSHKFGCRDAESAIRSVSLKMAQLVIQQKLIKIGWIHVSLPMKFDHSIWRLLPAWDHSSQSNSNSWQLRLKQWNFSFLPLPNNRNFCTFFSLVTKSNAYSRPYLGQSRSPVDFQWPPSPRK